MNKKERQRWKFKTRRFLCQFLVLDLRKIIFDYLVETDESLLDFLTKYALERRHENRTRYIFFHKVGWEIELIYFYNKYWTYEIHYSKYQAYFSNNCFHSLTTLFQLIEQPAAETYSFSSMHRDILFKLFFIQYQCGSVAKQHVKYLLEKKIQRVKKNRNRLRKKRHRKKVA